MAYLAIYLILTLIILLWSFLQFYYNYWQRHHVPHETPSFVFGNLGGFGQEVNFRNINKRLYQHFKALGASYTGMFIFFQKAALIIDLDLIKQILIKDFNSFADHGLFNNARDDPLAGHLARLDGTEWRVMRTKLTPVFTSGKIRQMFPTVVAIGQKFSSICATVAQQNKLHPNVIEVQDLCARYSTDVIGTCAFGIDCNSLQNPHAEFRRKGRDIFAHPRHSGIVETFMNTYPKLAARLRMKFFTNEVSDFFLDAVRQTIDYRLKNKVKRHDFMDTLIEMKAEDEEKARAGQGIDLSHGLTLEQIAAQVFVFYVASFDTAASTMTLCLYELAANPEIQQRLRTEIAQQLEKHNYQLSYECVNEMLYLEQVISETLRKYSVLAHLVRKAVTDYVVPQTKQVIERGTIIIVPVDALHLDPELYPNPDKFDPERFKPEAIQQRHSCAYLPFGVGPRNCIGMRFGKIQTKIGIISLLQSFKFSKCPLTEVPVKSCKETFVLEPEQGIYLRLDKISL